MIQTAGQPSQLAMRPPTASPSGGDCAVGQSVNRADTAKQLIGDNALLERTNCRIASDQGRALHEEQHSDDDGTVDNPTGTRTCQGRTPSSTNAASTSPRSRPTDETAYALADDESLDNVGFFYFADPDGNRWTVQQISARDTGR